MKKQFKVTLEDEGQDLLYFITDKVGVILEAGPFHNEIYKGGYIPIETQKVGTPCKIHNPPSTSFGILKYNVISIEEYNCAK